MVAPQPQGPAPGDQQMPPRWAIGAGGAALALGALRVAWSWYANRGAATAPPPPVPPLPQQPPPVLQPAGAAAVQQAGEAPAAAPAAANGAVAEAPAAAPVDETAAMTLEQLQSMATELYLLIQQVRGRCCCWLADRGCPPWFLVLLLRRRRCMCMPRLLPPRGRPRWHCGTVDPPTAPPPRPRLPPLPQMELQLQELQGELAVRLSEEAYAQLDALASQVEQLEERLAGLKVG